MTDCVCVCVCVCRGGRGRGRGRGGRGGKKQEVPTAEQLDADLEAYKQVNFKNFHYFEMEMHLHLREQNLSCFFLPPSLSLFSQPIPGLLDL